MGWKHPGQGKEVEPSSLRGMPEDVQTFARSLMEMAPNDFAHGLPLFMVAWGANRTSCFKTTHNAQFPVLSRAHHQSSISGPAPPGFNANDITYVHFFDLVGPKHQSHQTRFVPATSCCNGPGVRRRDDHPLWVHTEDNQFKPPNGCIGPKILNPICRGWPVKSGWVFHGRETLGQCSSRSSLDFFRRTRKEEATGSGSSAISSPPTNLLTPASYRSLIDAFGAFQGV